MGQTYDQTRERLETYFDRTASKTWERLTSDAPVSRIRQTVRAGRDRMRAALISALPTDLSGARVLDAGAGAGQMSIELAERGAEVLAVDISPSLLEVARNRTPEHLLDRITFKAGDMLDPYHGQFDFAIAMDSLIHYEADDIARALDGLSRQVDQRIAFTVAPKTTLLSAMHLAGKLFPRSDRSPAIVPISQTRLTKALNGTGTLERRELKSILQVNSGFYISHALELSR